MTFLPLVSGEQLPTIVIGPFSHEDLVGYASASGDFNPLHLDTSFAQSFGFSTCPVHGMRLLSAFEQLLRDWRTDLIPLSLKGQFLTPVQQGERATLSGRVVKVEKETTGLVGVVRLVGYTDCGAPAVVGEARLALRLGTKPVVKRDVAP